MSKAGLMLAEKVREILSGITKAPSNEKCFQDTISHCFDRAGFLYRREVQTSTGPVDFVVGVVAVEVKIKGSPVEISRQLIRYLQEPQFQEIILITTKPLRMPIRNVHTKTEIKPIHVVELWSQFI